jgi:hypothetical protein
VTTKIHPALKGKKSEMKKYFEGKVIPLFITRICSVCVNGQTD